MTIFSETELEILSNRQYEGRMHYGNVPYYFDACNCTRSKVTTTVAQILYLSANKSISYNKALIVATKINYMYGSALYYYTTDRTKPHMTPQEGNDCLESMIATLLWHEHQELIKRAIVPNKKALFRLRKAMYEKGYVLAFLKR